MTKHIQIREATMEDVKDILELILELARYEEGEDQVTVTLSELQRDFKAGIINAKIAEE